MSNDKKKAQAWMPAPLAALFVEHEGAMAFAFIDEDDLEQENILTIHTFVTQEGDRYIYNPALIAYDDEYDEVLDRTCDEHGMCFKLSEASVIKLVHIMDNLASLNIREATLGDSFSPLRDQKRLNGNDDPKEDLINGDFSCAGEDTVVDPETFRKRYYLRRINTTLEVDHMSKKLLTVSPFNEDALVYEQGDPELKLEGIETKKTAAPRPF